MDIGIISVRYAKALWAYASRRNEAAIVYAEMELLSGRLHTMERLRPTLARPDLADDNRLSLLTLACTADDGTALSSSTKQFLALVVQRHRTELMPFIAHAYAALYRRNKHIVRSQLTLAFKPSAALQTRLERFISQKAGGEVELDVNVDPSIGGGFILHYGTYRLDSSLRTRLERIGRQLGGRRTQHLDS